MGVLCLVTARVYSSAFGVWFLLDGGRVCMELLSFEKWMGE
jgi:hypothetical protein